MKNGPTVSKILIALTILSAITYVGCKKDRIKQNSLNVYDSPDSYLDSKKQEEQVFVIDSTGPGPIVGKQGTKIAGARQCLVKPNGDTITFPFTVKLVELYKAKDMIYYRMPTVAATNILRTDGEIRLRAFKDAVELVLKPNPCFAQIEMPNTSPRTDMRVFYGFQGANYPDWTDDPSKLGTPSVLNPVFTKTAYGYSAPIARLGWINCGLDASSTTSSVLSFASTVDDLTNIRFFIYLPSTKTVMEVYNTTSFNIPTGASAKIIGIGMQGSNLFHFYQTTTVTASTTIDVEMKAISDADLTALLDGL